MKPVLILSLAFLPFFAVASLAASQQDEVTLRRLVTQDYVTQWSKSEEREFSMDIARRIYLQEPSLRAIDTDIMQVPKSLYPSTRIRGADAYNRIWPEIFENIEYFRNLQVENLEVEINGDLALTTFDAPGHGRLRGKPKFSSYKNFTLLWQQTPDGWRIFHEHISDGRK